MNPEINQPLPKAYSAIQEATHASGFTMASDILTCSMLRTLARSKSPGKFLELGTGTGLATAWILDGITQDSTLVSLDNDATLIGIAKKFLTSDWRLSLIYQDGGQWIEQNKLQRFDFIFADTWPGKYFHLDDAISLLNHGGLYIIDDMLPQPNWPEGHEQKVESLTEQLEKRNDLQLTKLNWATGIIIAAKI